MMTVADLSREAVNPTALTTILRHAFKKVGRSSASARLVGPVLTNRLATSGGGR
jgi:hypothetical protein